MNEDVFVDTLYLVARLNPRDQWHRAAIEIDRQVEGRHLVTTETVLLELLNYLAEFPPEMREAVSKFTTEALNGPAVEVILHTHDIFLRGLEFYGHRLDKGYSLTDCILMLLMRDRGVQEILTHDDHFLQEGFTILL